MQNSLVVAVVLNWNAADETIDCVNSLLHSSYENLQIIIIDNFSTDNSLYIIKKTFPSLKIICNNINSGYAAGNNLGIKWALENGAKYILVLNNDVVVDSLMIKVLVEDMIGNPQIGVISCKVFYKDEPKRIFSGAGKFIRWRCTGVNRGTLIGRNYKHDKKCFVNYVSGVLFLTKVEVFKELGLLDERYFMYFEDLEFSMRVLPHYLIAYSPHAIAYHKSGGGTRWSNYSEVYLYYQTRNRLIVFENKNFFYQMYVLLFTILITIAKTTAIIFSFGQDNPPVKKRLSALWRGLKDGILYIMKNRV